MDPTQFNPTPVNMNPELRTPARSERGVSCSVGDVFQGQPQDNGRNCRCPIVLKQQFLHVSAYSVRRNGAPGQEAGERVILG